jgi:hypothetical protein
MRMAVRAAAVTALLFSAGCVETYQIPPVQLQYLNGYDIHGEQSSGGATFTALPYRLISTQGDPVDYNSTKQLILLGATRKQLAPPGPFELIFINDTTFDAVPLKGPPVQVPLDDIKAVEIVQPNPEQTSQVLTIIGVITSLLLTGITIAAVAH